MKDNFLLVPVCSRREGEKKEEEKRKEKRKEKTEEKRNGIMLRGEKKYIK